MKRVIVALIMIPALILLSIVPITGAFAAEQLCISRIVIESGDGAAEKLESSGYTVLYQNLNPSGGERIYLGYQLGEKPITGLTVSSEQKRTLSVDSVSYTLVSAINLNQGTKGSPVYLYSTTDPKAGGGIVSLNCVKDSRDGSVNLLEKLGDGSVPVRTADGNAANFDEGIEKRDLYLFTIHENACKPYVSDIRIVNVGSEENAFKKIVASGCNYFNAEPVAKTNGTSAYLCYNRTADASDAVRFAAFSDSSEIDGITYVSAGSLNGSNVSLYYTKDRSVGNPVSEITKGSLTTEKFTKGDWAKAYFSRTESSAMSNIYNEDLYKALIESDEEYTQLQIKNHADTQKTDLYMILSAKGLKTDGREERVVTLPSEQSEENAEMQRDTEITGISKESTSNADTEKSEGSVNASGSAIGRGSLIAVAVMAVIAVIAVLSVVIVKGRKKTDN